MPSFSGVDYLDFDSVLTDEEKLARNTTRQFVDDQIMPIIEEYNREGKFPMQLVPQMAELGLFGASLKGYGCAGMSNVEYGLVTQELERGDSGLRSFVSVQSALVMYPIYTFGSDTQKDKWLPLLQQGKAIGCFGLTEPQFGSNPGGMLTRAVKKGDKYVLNGEKMWITSGSLADVALVWAKCEDEKIRGFLVEKGTPGFKAWDVHGKYSLRASVTSGLSMTDCEIPAENVLPGVEGLTGPLSLPESGALRHRLGRALARPWPATTRRCSTPRRASSSTNKPIASHQLVQEKLAWMITEIIKAQLLALHVGRLKDAGTSRSCAHFHAENEQRVDGAGNGAQARATFWGPTASSTITALCATWPISNRSSPTKARTISTSSSSANASPASRHFREKSTGPSRQRGEYCRGSRRTRVRFSWLFVRRSAFERTIKTKSSHHHRVCAARPRAISETN